MEQTKPLLPQPILDENGSSAANATTMDFKPTARQGFLSIGSAFLYGFMAVTMVFVNKMSMQLLPLPNVVMVLQMVATLAVLQPLHTAGVLDFPPFSWRTCRRLLGITLLYTANTCLALFGLRSLNVPMYNVLKRLTPMMVLAVKSAVRRRWPQPQVSLSVLLVVAGCVVAGLGDLAFDPAGYLFALGSCTMQAAYLLLVEFQGAGGISTSEMLYYNALSSLPFLLLVVAATGEAGQLPGAYAAAVGRSGAATLWGTLAACSLMGCLLNYSLFLCTVNNSALTTTIVGVLKGVVAVVLGFFLLGGVPFSLLNVSGIALNTAGAVWYTAIKYMEKERDRQGGRVGGSGVGAAGSQMMVSASADPVAALGPSSSASALSSLGQHRGGATGAGPPSWAAAAHWAGGGAGPGAADGWQQKWEQPAGGDGQLAAGQGWATGTAGGAGAVARRHAPV